MKLIFSGKILEDSKTLESYSIKPDSFLVVVKQAPTKTTTVSHIQPFRSSTFTSSFQASAASPSTQSNTATSARFIQR